jgi:hypothetical protein
MKPHKRNTQLGEKIEPFEFPFEESAWNDLALNLDAQAKPPTPEWKKRLFFLGLLFLTIGFGVFISRKNEDNSVVSLKNEKTTNSNAPTEQQKSNMQRSEISNPVVETPATNAPYIYKDGEKSAASPILSVEKTLNNASFVSVENAISAKNETVKKAIKTDLTVSNDAKTIDNQGITTAQYINKDNITHPTPTATDSNSVQNINKTLPFYAQFNTTESANAQVPSSSESSVSNETRLSTTTLPSTQVEPLNLLKHTTISSLNANFWADVSPTIPYISPSRRLKNRHQLTVGGGTGFFITQFHGSKSAFGAYTYRLSPMSALGTSVNYTKTPDGGYATNIEGQINIYLAERRHFTWLLTTGYGYRSYHLLDDNTPPYQKYVTDKAKGLTMGTEFHYKFSNRSFIGLRLDSKINYSQNTGLFLQYGMNF